MVRPEDVGTRKVAGVDVPYRHVCVAGEPVDAGAGRVGPLDDVRIVDRHRVLPARQVPAHCDVATVRRHDHRFTREPQDPQFELPVRRVLQETAVEERQDDVRVAQDPDERRIVPPELEQPRPGAEIGSHEVEVAPLVNRIDSPHEGRALVAETLHSP